MNVGGTGRLSDVGRNEEDRIECKRKTSCMTVKTNKKKPNRYGKHE